jgi:hypothetical protein
MTIRIAFPHPRTRCSRDLSLERERRWEGHGSASRTPVKDTYAHSHITKPILSSASSAIPGNDGDGRGAVVTGSIMSPTKLLGHGFMSTTKLPGRGFMSTTKLAGRGFMSPTKLPGRGFMSPTKLPGRGLQTPKAPGINWTEDKVQEALDVKRKTQGPILPVSTFPIPLLVQRDRRVRSPSNTSPFPRDGGARVPSNASPFPGRGRVSIASAGEGYLCG